MCASLWSAAACRRFGLDKLDRNKAAASRRTPKRRTIRAELITGTQQNFSLAGLKYEHLPAVAYAPTFKPWRRGYVFGDDETFVADLIRGVGFDCEAGAGRHGKRNLAVAGPRRKRVEVAVQRDLTVAGARIDLTVKLGNLNAAVASIHVELAAAVRNVD